MEKGDDPSHRIAQRRRLWSLPAHVIAWIRRDPGTALHHSRDPVSSHCMIDSHDRSWSVLDGSFGQAIRKATHLYPCILHHVRLLSLGRQSREL